MNTVGTMSIGLKLPIMKTGQDLFVQIARSLQDACEETGFNVEENDVIAVTESIVARTAGEYIHII